MKKHYAQRQKERIQQLEIDIRKILNGDNETIMRYKLINDSEKMMWNGTVKHNNI